MFVCKQIWFFFNDERLRRRKQNRRPCYVLREKGEKEYYRKVEQRLGTDVTGRDRWKSWITLFISELTFKMKKI